MKNDWRNLVQQATRNDREAFGKLVERFQAMAVGYAFATLNDYELAQDAAQEAFIQAYISLNSLESPDAFPGWFRRIVFSQCTRYLRGRHFRTLPLETALSLTADNNPQELVERQETQRTIQAAIQSLPETERATVTLFYLGGYSHAEVGQFLDVPLSTIKSRLHSARQRLRERIVTTMEQSIPQLTPNRTFTERVLSGIQKLSWAGQGPCTFAGALAVATAATPHPLDYQTILGVTGLAFRTRWFTGPKEQPWCPSSPVGEFPEEIAAARKATGWQLREESDMTAEKLTPQIMATIDAGIPALAYDQHLNMSVLCGYEDEGRTVLLQSYSSSDAPLKRPTADLPIVVIFLDKHTGNLSPHDAAVQGLTLAIQNFKRRHDPADSEERGYWFGAAALARWAEDIGNFDHWTEEEREKLLFVSWWTFQNLADARTHASAFLRQVAPLFRQAARPALEAAVHAYNRETNLIGRSFVNKDVFLGPWTGKSLNDWTSEVRAHEQEIFAAVLALETEAVGHIEAALSTEQ